MCRLLEAGFADGLLGGSRLTSHILHRLLFQPFHMENAQTIRHIVIYRVGNIGDTVVAVAALWQIRQTFPQARITLLTSAGSVDLPGATQVLKAFPTLVNRVISYQPEEIKQIKGFQAIKADTLQNGPVDLFIDLPVSLQTLRRNLQELFLAKALGSRFALGFDQIFPPVFKPAWSLKHPDKIPQTSAWLCDLLSRAGFPKADPLPEPALPEISPILEKTGLSEDKPLLLVNAGAKLAMKQWPIKAFIHTLQPLLQENRSLQVGLLGSAPEYQRNQEIITAIHPEQLKNERVKNLSGQLDLSETFALIRHAQAVLSNDTGPMHMAGLMGTPIITPMSGQYPAPLWHPPGPGGFTPFRHTVTCSPCFLERCPYSDQPCLNHLQPEALVQSIQSHLS